MLKVTVGNWKISRVTYQPQNLRAEIGSFLNGYLPDTVWRHRLLVVANELIANSCEHRFDDDSIVFSIRVTHFRDHVRVQMLLDDKSNLLIMQRYNNLLAAVDARKKGKSLHGVNGHGLKIILLWTDDVQFSKKRVGGLSIKVVKSVTFPRV